MGKAKKPKSIPHPAMDVLSEKERTRFDTEWTIINALRELAHIALRENDPPTYRRVLRLGELLLPGIFAVDDRIIDRAEDSLELKFYREKALAETRKQGRNITELSLVEADIEELESQINANPDGSVLRSKMNILLILKRTLKATRHEEGELIFRDAFASGLEFDSSGTGQRYAEYRLDDNRALKISVFHPTVLEHKTGADLLYEIYDVKKRTARVAVVQYKMWDKESLHRTNEMARQLEKLSLFACEKDYSTIQTLCVDDPIPRGKAYRLPYCAAFLRPTDRLQRPNSQKLSTGYHIPVCVANSCWVKNQRSNVSIRKEHILDRSLSENVFRELFLSGMIGSRETSFEHLTELYRHIGIFENDQVVLVHARWCLNGVERLAS